MFAGRPPGADSVTLFHVLESLPDELVKRTGDADHAETYRKVCRDLDADSKVKGEALLVEQKQSLVDAGVAESDIERKLILRESHPGAGKVVASLAIIEEMHAGGYDVVCLGRRGETGAAGSFLGSVAEKVLREARGRTVWVVD